MIRDAPLSTGTVDAAMEGLGSAEPVRQNRFRVTVPTSEVLEAIRRAQDRLGCDHLVQIATVDTGSAFELHYHLTGPHRSVVTVRVQLPRDDPRIASAHSVLPAASLYERQIHDLFGIVFEGHPDPRRLILNEDWPSGEHPLRKDWKMDPARSYGGVPTEGE